MGEQMVLAINYIRRVKTAFATEPHKFETFLAILNDYKTMSSNRKLYSDRSIECLTRQRIEDLFHSQPELIKDFKMIGTTMEGL